MKKIALAGGQGDILLEIQHGLLTATTHEILVLSRKPEPVQWKENVSVHGRCSTWVQVDYNDVSHLTEILKGTHTLLSFITTQTDPGEQTQRNLIEAAITAGVKRFAPSEWATSDNSCLPVFAGKDRIREHLAELNRDQKVIEYCLFQPGLFTNYLAHPKQSALYFRSFETHIDLQHSRALVREQGWDDHLTLTLLQDFVAVVVQAIDYEEEWPIVGGIKGCDIKVNDLIDLGTRITGYAWSVGTSTDEELLRGVVRSSWLPIVQHQGIPKEVAQKHAQPMTAGMILAIANGAFEISDEWNRLLPNWKPQQPEGFLGMVWGSAHRSEELARLAEGQVLL